MTRLELPTACLLALLAGLPAQAASAPSPYQPLAFLVGHCWKGEFPGGKKTDEHCFSWIYGGKFVRDEHVVHSADGAPDQFGETIYVWNSAAGQVEYLYIESTGGLIRGAAASEGDALVFPAAGYLEGGESMNVRSRWQRAGQDAYDVVTEFEMQGRWVPGFKLHMQRVRAAP
jgi:hypothetical protein